MVTASQGLLPILWVWDPAEIPIARGDRVTWENPTEAMHRIIAWDGPWEVAADLDVMDKVTFKFKKPGVYRYWCDVLGHSDVVYHGEDRTCVGMCGVVIVE